MSRNIFIDCGANLGQGFERLRNRYDLSIYEDIYMFEPLPNAFNFLKEKYIHAKIYNQAVWIDNIEKMFGIEIATIDGIPGVGHASNVLGEKYLRTDNPHLSWIEIPVQCIDFATFLKDNFDTTDNIFVKFDIEGAEYSVLEKLIETNTLQFIKTINIEFHSHLLRETQRPESYYLDIFKKHNIEVI